MMISDSDILGLYFGLIIVVIAVIVVGNRIILAGFSIIIYLLIIVIILFILHSNKLLFTICFWNPIICLFINILHIRLIYICLIT
jgi:hypothetical protein